MVQQDVWRALWLVVLGGAWNLAGCQSGTPVAAECATLDDCGPGEACFEGECLTICQTSEDCGNGEVYCLSLFVDNLSAALATGTSISEINDVCTDVADAVNVCPEECPAQ